MSFLIADRHFMLTGVLPITVRNPDTKQCITVEMGGHSVEFDAWLIS